ncbi:uncharacterized protein MONOS_17270 [Monocercomonoides exilis]|uniref:uncharacterized protein n=1 Tax=Monocercomonoides exilis TaxID=2049356 RepID=UPI00355A4CB1|nr:hypothetical protein MONOS_17270 [Monocercomonoides exilis]
MDVLEEIEAKYGVDFHSNPILRQCLTSEFDPFTHFEFSESFNADETLSLLQSALKTVDSTLELILADNLPKLRNQLHILDTLKTIHETFVQNVAELESSLKSLTDEITEKHKDVQDSFNKLKSTKATLDDSRIKASMQLKNL